MVCTETDSEMENSFVCFYDKMIMRGRITRVGVAEAGRLVEEMIESWTILEMKLMKESDYERTENWI